MTLQNPEKFLRPFNKHTQRGRLILSMAFLAVLLTVTELAVRASGLTDFPLYDANSRIGYIPRPSQSGDFLRTNHWQFNSLSMGGPEFTPSSLIDTLLIGDSVVLGGNPYKEADRLGPQLQRNLQRPVWPISAGSWSLRNELTYLDLHPEVVRASDQFIFVSNNKDFDEASSWSCEKTHPRSRPALTSIYVFKKYIWDWESCNQTPSDLLVPKGDWKHDLRAFLGSESTIGKSIIFILYPDKDEVDGKKDIESLESHAREIFAEANATKSRVLIFSIAKDSRWKPGYYRDEIHPTVEGTRVLAEIISNPETKTSIIPNE